LSWQIRAERAEDGPLVERLLAESFGPGRFAKSAFRLREGVKAVPGLSFVAVEEGEVRGSVRFWPIRVGKAPALLLGPLAVQGPKRGRGMGIDLMRRGISEAKVAGWEVIILVGDEPYYSRVGFSRLTRRLRFPGPVDPARILGLDLKEGTLAGLSGEVRRTRIDEPFCADGAGTA
jgi:predicted N-acetyltransferase YhbS